MKKIIKILKEKWLKDTTLTIILVAIILAIFIIVNALIQKADITPIDFTQEKVYSLSDESKEEIKKVEQNVIMYFFGYSESSTPVVLGKKYHEINDKITVQVVSINERPDLATEYGIQSGDQLIAVTSSQRYKAIDSYDMYTYDSQSGETIDITEQKITNAILDVTIVNKPQVYFLTGHGEYPISGSAGYLQTLSQYIVNDVNDVNTLDLLSNDMPEKCDVLVIANPTSDFTEVETKKIQTYINNGGKIMWMQDPYINVPNYNSDTFKNINKILKQFGISFSKGIVCESSKDNIVSGNPDLIIPQLTYNSIVKDIYTDGKIIMTDAGKINNVSDEELKKLNVTVEEFIKTTNKAYYKENFEKMLNQTKDDETGEFVLGEILTKKLDNDKKAVLVAYSSAYFATNDAMPILAEGGYTTVAPIGLRNNKDILLNTIAYLTDREDSIRIRKNVGVVTFDTATAKQVSIVKTVIFTIPLAIIVAGIIVTVVRKKTR